MRKMMRHGLRWASAFCLIAFAAVPAMGDVIYNNLTPNNMMAIATRPDTTAFEIEAGDDFFLKSRTSINGASFIGLIVPGSAGAPSVSQVVVERYRLGQTRRPMWLSTPVTVGRIR